MFSAPESTQNNFLPMRNVSSGEYTHSSPFGLGLSIGGLEHMIGKQQSAESMQPASNEISNSSVLSYAQPIWNNFTAHQQTPRANIDTQPAVGSPNTSTPSFPIPLERLFNLPLIPDSQVYTTGEESHTAAVSAPWPPNRE